MERQIKLLVLVFSLLITRFLFADDIKVENKEFNEKNDELRYEIKVNYPQLKGMSNEDAQVKINSYIEYFITQSIKDSKNEMKDWQIPDELDFNSSFEFNYGVDNLNNDVFSIRIENFSYYAGAAHPSTYISSMNFNLTNGEYINFSELFRSDSDYLQYISDFCIFDLKRSGRENEIEFDDEWLNTGAGPIEENFKSYNITEKGLIITFNDYQVGPYVIGQQEVLIPYEKITNIVNLDGLLKPFLN